MKHNIKIAVMGIIVPILCSCSPSHFLFLPDQPSCKPEEMNHEEIEEDIQELNPSYTLKEIREYKNKYPNVSNDFIIWAIKYDKHTY